MADTEKSTFNTARVLGNEIVKSDDFNFGFESLVHNITKFAQMIFECERDFVIGGKVTVDSGTNVKIAPIFGVCASTGDPFGMTEQSDVISITQDDYHSRIDIIEAKGEWVAYDEQQRAFNDLDNDIVTYQNIDVKQRLKVTYQVKNGVNDSVTAPATDEGWVKIAEIKYAKGTAELSQSDILNITADVAGLENSGWTNEKTKTYNVNYISQVNARFRGEHNADGTHKNGIVHSAQVDFGTSDKQVNASKLPITASGTVGSASYNTGDSVNATLVTFANQFATVYNNYVKYGINCFKGEVSLSMKTGSENKLEKPLVFGAAGDGSAYCKIDSKTVFTITSDGKIRMAAGYVPVDSMDVVTKSVTDEINGVINKIDERVTTLESTSDSSTIYANNLFSRFSYIISGKIDAATTANIALSGLQTVDDVSLSVGMLILVKNQTDSKQNGIYEVNSNNWQRHSEFSSFDSIKHKLFIISNGTSNKNKIFYTPQENFSGSLGKSELFFSEYVKIDTRQLKDSSITTDKIANSAITNSKIANSAITNSKIGEALSITNGGTGKTTANAAINNLATGIEEATGNGADTMGFITTDASSMAIDGTNTKIYKRSGSKVWNWIQSKISSVLGLTQTSYGGKAASASNADKIEKTVSTVGSESTIFAVTGSTDGASLTWGPEESDHGVLKLKLIDDANSEFRILQQNTQVLQAIDGKCNINGSASYAESASYAGSASYAESAGSAKSASSVAWNNVSDKPAYVTGSYSGGVLKLTIN